MKSHESAELTKHDRNAAIAEASNQQHRINVERALHYLGLDPQGAPSVYTADDIYDFVMPLYTRAELTGHPNQLTIDIDPSSTE